LCCLEAGDEPLIVNELIAAYRAVRGLVEALEAAQSSHVESAGHVAAARDDLPACLYLPTEDARLVASTELVFNDLPAYYERLAAHHRLRFIVDMRQCAVRSAFETVYFTVFPDFKKMRFLRFLRFSPDVSKSC